MENDKVFEMIERIYSEIEATKVAFTEKVEVRLNEIENKINSSKENIPESQNILIDDSSVDSLNSFQEDVSKKMDGFNETFEEIQDTIGLQALTINNLTQICKMLMVITSVSLIVVIIVLFRA